jgi:hypothetical protein
MITKVNVEDKPQTIAIPTIPMFMQLNHNILPVYRRLGGGQGRAESMPSAATTPVRPNELRRTTRATGASQAAKTQSSFRFIVVDPGSAVDPVRDDPPDPPSGPDPPPKSTAEYGRNGQKGCMAAVIGRWGDQLPGRCSKACSRSERRADRSAGTAEVRARRGRRRAQVRRAAERPAERRRRDQGEGVPSIRREAGKEFRAPGMPPSEKAAQGTSGIQAAQGKRREKSPRKGRRQRPLVHAFRSRALSGDRH